MKKKILALTLVFLMMLSLMPVGAFAMEQINEGKEKTVVFAIDQKNYSIGDNKVETDVAPYIKSLDDGIAGGRTMVPVAFVARALGTEPAVWHPEKRMVTIKKGDKNISITIGSKELLVNGKKIVMDVAAEIKNVGNGGGRTMLPIAFIARALEVGYEWNGETRSVSFYGFTKTYAEKGTFGPVSGTEIIEGNVVIKADGVILQNTIVKGNLTIAEEVGNGDVTLNNITVKGETNIRGGGKDSIHINGGQYKNITIQNVDNKIRIVAKDVNNLDVVISEDAKEEEIILEGIFKSLKIEAAQVHITTQGQTTIKDIIVDKTAVETELNLGKDTVVNKMVLYSETEVKGTGTIKQVDVNADGVIFEKAPEKQTVAAGIEVPKTVTPTQPASGGGGGGGGTTIAVSTIAVTPSTMTLTAGEATGIITALITPTDATNKNVNWSSSDTNVATVANGVITPVAAGTATITATSASDRTKTATTVITVITVEQAVATSAVVTAEVSNSQADVDTAQVLVTALPDGVAKTALQSRIDGVQAITNAVAALAATSAVETAEATPTQGNINAAQVLVTALPAGAAKIDLQGRLDAVQAIVDAAAALAAATSAVVTAEGSNLQADVDAAQSLVSALSAGAAKIDLQGRLDAVQAIVDAAAALAAATSAVVTAEGSNLQADVDAAQSLVSALPAGAAKIDLQGRLDAVQAIVDAAAALAAATSAVVTAEGSNLQADVDTAQSLVTALPDGAAKIDLQGRLDAVQAIVDAAAALAAATSAVVTAEGSNLQADVDTAQSLVTALPDGAAKIDLQGRLDAVQDIIDTVEETTANAASVGNVKVLVEGRTYTIAQSAVTSEAGIKTAIESIISGLALDGVTATVTKVEYTPATAGLELTPVGTNGTYTFKVVLSKGEADTFVTDTTTTQTMTIIATAYVAPKSIISSEITNFNFKTVNSTQAQLVSKAITTSNFGSGNSKSFTITDKEGNVIPVNLNWNIPLNEYVTTPAAAVGSAVESYIQQWFYDHKGGAAGIMNRTMYASSFGGNTFTIGSFQTGGAGSITIGGADANYFFDVLQVNGTDYSTSANKTFTISDGTNTANILFNSDLIDMNGLVNTINDLLDLSSVQAEAIKINDNSFKILGDNITISGTDKGNFFSTFVSQ